MTTISFPAVGKKGFSESKWATYFDSFDGVVDGYAGSLDYTPIETGSGLFRIATGMGSVNGFRLVVVVPEDLIVPAVSSLTTFYIGIQYDPLLNVANETTGEADPLGPCRLVLTANVDTSGGKAFVLLYSFTRAPGQAVSSVVVADWRRPISAVTIDWPDSMANPPVGNFNLPQATIRYARDNKRFLVRTRNAAGALDWVDALNSGPFPLPLSSAFVAQSGTKTVPQYVRYASNRISFEGRIERANKKSLSTGGPVVLGQMPVGSRPPFVRSFICRCGGVGNQVEVRINSDASTPPDGQIIMTDPADSTDWLDLSGIDYRIGA